MKIKTKPIGDWITNNFYVIVLLTYFFTMVFNTETHFLRVLWFFILLLNINSFLKTPKSISITITIFVIYNIATIISYFFNGLPLSLFFKDIIDSILPISFFYIGFNSQNTDSAFYKQTLRGMIFMFIVGLYLYLLAPDWYIAWQVNQSSEIISGLTESHYLEAGRFSSFLSSSYYTAYLSIVSIVLSLYFFRTSKNYNYIYLIFVIISIVSMILSQQRAAIAYGILLMLGVHIYAVMNFKNKGIYLIFIFDLIIVVLSSYILIDRFGNMFLMGLNRMNELDTVISSRSNTWETILENQTNFITGNGLGSGGHAAFFYGVKHAVRDGNYFKILYELGIVGIFLFFSIIISSLYRSIKKFKYLWVELLIIVFYIMAAIGSNVFTMSYLIVIFWYCIGRIWNKEYLNKLIQSDNIQ